MATTKISTGVLKDGSVTSAKLDTNISIVGDLTVDTNTLFVDSASNRVGIGTTSPAAKLDVEGLMINGSTNPSIMDGGNLRKKIEWNGALNSFGVYNTTNAGVDWQTNLLVDSSGNVGIGTSSPNVAGFPSTTLTIEGNSGNYGAFEIGSANVTAAGQRLGEIRFYNKGTTAPYGISSIRSIRGTNIADSELSFWTSLSNATVERMRIDSSGNVGIGTSSPTGKLQVNGGGVIASISDWNTSANTVFHLANPSVRLGIGYNASDNPIIQGFSSSNSVKDIGLQVYGGKVGIGTSSPELPLDVRGIIQTKGADSLLRIGQLNATSTYIQSISADTTTSRDLVFFGTAERMRITSTGNVGIGTTSPNAKLRVENATASVTPFLAVGVAGYITVDNVGSGENYYGAVAFHSFATNNAETMRLTSAGDLHVDGDVIAYSTTISDQRLKDDIQTIDNALDKVSNLRGVSYTWNNGNRKGQKDLGLIAQEVEQVLPELVREKEMPMIDGGTYKTVDYEKIVGVLIEAVKELKAEVESLKSK